MPNQKLVFCGGLIAAVFFGRSAASASSNAADNAGNSAYNSGWVAGSNGGTGFGPWAFGGATQSLGNSSGNGVPNNTGDINTPHSVSGRSWGLSSNGLAFATRPFTGGALAVGQTFKIAFDSGTIPPNGIVAFDLSNVSDTDTIWGFGAYSGSSDFYITDNSNARRDTGVPLTDAGVQVSFLLTSDTTYSVAITPIGSATTTISGTLINPLSGDHSLDNTDFVAAQNGTNSSSEVFFNSMSIVPEPSCLALLGIATVGSLLRRHGRGVE